LTAACQAHQTLSGKNSRRQNSHLLSTFKRSKIGAFALSVIVRFTLLHWIFLKLMTKSTIINCFLL